MCEYWGYRYVLCVVRTREEDFGSASGTIGRTGYRKREGDTIRDMAADQARALTNLGITKASVMGVSQGGMIAQYLAIDYPEMVEKLVIAVSAPRVNEVIQDCVGRWIKIAERGDHKSLMIEIAEKGYSEKYLKKYRIFTLFWE